MGLPREIEGRWTSGVVLKRDLLSTVERGRFGTRAGDVEAVLRRIDEVPWWSFGLARHLFARERRALAIAGELGIAPPLLFAGRDALIRGWIDGLPLHIAKPRGERSFFCSAKAALRKLHRAGICHNDLAKEQNWLRGRDGRAYLTDFQLAARFSRRSWLFRIAAYEDLRHLLKHKRRYAEKPGAARAGEEEPLDPGLDGDRQEALLPDHPRRVARQRPRGRRDAAPLRRTPHRGAAQGAPAGARGGGRGLSRPPRRHRPLRVRRRRSGAYRARPARIPRGRDGSKNGPQIARASAADPRIAARRFGRGAQRDPRARCHEPSRPDRVADRKRRRARRGGTHRRRSPQPTRPIRVLAKDPPRPPGRAPDDQLPPPRRDCNRHEWIVAAPLHAGERRRRERDR